MPPQEDHSRIEELKKSLYSRTAPDVRTRRKLRFGGSTSELKTDWEHPEEKPEEPVMNQDYEDHSMSFFTKLLIGSIIFAVIAVGIGAYLFFNGANLVSADNIDISINGPVSIQGGEPVSFGINVTNRNDVALQLVDMSVDFPAGATDPNDPTKTLQTYHKLIGDLSAGALDKETVQAIIFGEENIQKEILVSVSYGIKGSSAIFTKTKAYDVLINSSPINVTVSSFKEITSGQEFNMKIDIKSNSQQTLKNLLLKATYPFGYTFLTSDIPALSDKASWRIGDLPAGAKRTITIHGKLLGEDSEAKAFHFIVGSQASTAGNIIATEYMSVEQDMTIQKPFVSLSVSIDSDTSSGDYVSQFEKTSQVAIPWFNNLSTPVTNMIITAKLSGSAYDKVAVQPSGGYFDSANNQIIWNPQTNSKFSSVAPGDSGQVTFIITPKDKGTASQPIINPSITITANVSGSRAQETNVPQAIASAASRTINVSSSVSLSGRVVRTTGPFTNTGPVPPKVEQATTYTIIWTVDNTSNSVGNAQVTATLPPYVKWLGATSPATENVTYDQNSGLITWDIGDIGTYTVSSSHRRELDFQISLTPGINQASQVVTLVNKATLNATDNFTKAQLESTQDYVTTSFSTDPAFLSGQEMVAK